MVTLVFLRAYRRFVIVAWQFLPLLVSYARDRNRFLFFGSSRQVTSEMRRERADTLLSSLLTLGPTFIKLGQLLSSRPDVLPPEYVDELSKLQDEVPPAPWEDAQNVLEAELGPIEDNFEEFDTDAISGASLGQVYDARIDGERVAVKVRRPGIEDLVAADLRVIRWSLPVLMRFLGQGRAFSLENLADEFGRTIREEMDYDREASMLNEIRTNFEDDPDIVIPRVIESHSGSRVLTMEFLGGTKINRIDELDEEGLDRHELAVNLQRAYLQMIIQDGVFHADPHPGNLAVTDDGSIIFYDFGMSGHVDDFIQRKIVEFYIAVANQDIEGILDALIEMGTLSPEADRRTMGQVMELAIEDARGEDIETYRVQQIVSQVEDTIYEFPLRLPSNLALVLRVATVVEGVCVTLDPGFDFIAVATEYLTEEGYREESIKQYVSETGDQLQASAQSLVRTPPKLERALDRIDRDDLYARVSIEDDNDVFDLLAKRLIYGILLAFGGLTTAVLYVAEAFPAAAVAGLISLFVTFLLYRSFRKRRGIRTTPQFTRQNLRERDGE
ncbi:AarF/UbiB family protein [Haladaptatus sp. AB643]|uniref:ABC1 kinase family protein n=1 Tax=unclassified Haladaptatus TaxID=2622732 RepID=UPI00209BF122|nr:AarF/ABC1/UbiB kinase family protein [Haladaptatus sp. AB643]MCO8253290.1 AarF/ABC1/UbiB kinase family protein [Haladaptatus sp. AB618]